MFGFISWVIGIVFGIAKNPIAIAIVRTVGKLISGLPPGATTKCYALVQAAMERTDLTGPQKFQLVFDEMMKAYPEIGVSALNTLIEAVESTIRKD
jgi:hypothetical protein